MRLASPSLKLAVAATLMLACSESSAPPPDDSVRPESELTILRLAATSPPLWNPVDSFYAKKGVDREVRIFFQDQVGGSGEEYLRLRIDAPTLLARPDGTPFQTGDSVKIVVRVVDPARILVELEPSGLTFNPSKPAELKIEYGEAGDDLNEDGVVNQEDEEIERRLDIWRQAQPGAPFVRVGTAKFEDLDEIEAKLLRFSRYAIAY